MSQKGKRGKPTRKQVDEALKNLYQGLQYLGQKVDYLEGMCKSNEGVFDIYLEYKGQKEDFMKFLSKYVEEKNKEAKKEVAKEEETS